MQDCRTILAIIEMRLRDVPYEVCQSRLGISSTVVTGVMRQYEQLRCSLDALQAMPPDEVEELFYPPEKRRRKKMPMPDYEAMYERMSAKGSKVNATLLWQEYRKETPDGYGYTQFQKYFKEYIEAIHGSANLKMIVQRNPGEKMYVDWMGDQPELLVDPISGDLRKVHVYCSTLGVSSLGYADFFEDETLPNFIAGTANALNYYGALPRYIVSDNLRAAVVKNTKDALVLTTACQDLERFYDVIILPAPPRKPKGKPTVEHYVGFAERRLVELLRKDGPYPSLEELKERALPIIDDMNSRLERGRTATRRRMFESIDLPCMRPLPERCFALWDYVMVAKIPDTYHVTYDRHQYSVPYKAAGKAAVIKASVSDVIITDEHNHLIARHKRSYKDFPRTVTDPSHLAPQHKYYRDVNEMDGRKYRDWAEAMGPVTAEVIACILGAAEYEEQMYESCTGLMYHAKDIPAAVVEDAAKTCKALGKCTCSMFRQVITDKMNARQTLSAVHVPENASMRGKEFYS